MVQIDTFSKELCGGTHVERTGDIGICKIVYEGSISAAFVVLRRLQARVRCGSSRKRRRSWLAWRDPGERRPNLGCSITWKNWCAVAQLEAELQQLKTRDDPVAGRGGST